MLLKYSLHWFKKWHCIEQPILAINININQNTITNTIKIFSKLKKDTVENKLHKFNYIRLHYLHKIKLMQKYINQTTLIKKMALQKTIYM